VDFRSNPNDFDGLKSELLRLGLLHVEAPMRQKPLVSIQRTASEPANGDGHLSIHFESVWQNSSRRMTQRASLGWVAGFLD
jgi:hypothetical protein